MAGQPEIALGDALGSNVVNVAVVLGVVLVLGPLQASRPELRRELTFAALAPMLTLLALVDGRLVRAEAGVLLMLFVVWFAAVVRQALRERTDADDVDDAPSRLPAAAFTVVGLITLIVAGRLIVTAAKDLGADLGLDPFVVGATLVAFGTSTPELATALIARRRGHADIGVGTVLGSNVFNNLWVVGVAALLHPVRTSVSEVVLAVGACLVALLLVVPTSIGSVPRWRGGVLLVLAVGYMAATIAIGG
jgi:cation:H+ antiporter